MGKSNTNAVSVMPDYDPASSYVYHYADLWIPAFAGMTISVCHSRLSGVYSRKILNKSE